MCLASKSIILNCIHEVNQNKSIKPKITLNYFIENDHLNINFTVAPYLNPLINHSYSLNQSSIGLWDYDVVEAFIAVSSNNNTNLHHYYEFQLSPLNQYFELEIFEPRKKLNEKYTSKFLHISNVIDHKWDAQFQIPLSSIQCKDKSLLYGNFFSCLGNETERSYWSAYLPNQVKPDFHLPQYFRKLFN